MGTTKKRKPNHQVNKKEIMVKRKPLNAVEKLILDTLYKKDVPMTPNAIAEVTGLAYVTVRKYIAKLILDDVLIESWIKKPKKKYKMKEVEKFKKKLIDKARKSRSESKRYVVNPKVFDDKK